MDTSTVAFVDSTEEYLNSTGNGTAITGLMGPPMTVPSWSLYVHNIMLSIIFFLGVPGNALILIVQWKNGKKSTTDYLVMSMAVYELLCSGFNAPMRILKHNDILFRDFANTFLCKFNVFLHSFTVAGSAQTLAAIAVDRCIKTCLPLNSFYNETQAKRLCVALLFTSICLATPSGIMFYWNTTVERCLHTSYAMMMFGGTWGQVGSAVYFLCFVIMAFSYINIIIALQRRHQQKVNLRFNKRQPKSGDDRDEATVPGHAMVSTTFPDQQTEISQIGISSTSVDASNITVQMTDVNSSCPSPALSHKSTDGMGSSSNITNDKSGTNGTSGTGQVVKQRAPNVQVMKERQLLLEGRSLNRLTVIMFMISVVYLLSWVLNWILYIAGPFFLGMGAYLLSFYIPMINCITNAVVFFVMSSRFRQNAKALCCGSKSVYK